MSKSKHGQYVAMYWDDEPQFDIIRGHVDEAAARATLKREGCHSPERGTFVQCWARSIPNTWICRALGTDTEIKLYATASRGAYPVTALVYDDHLLRDLRPEPVPA